MVHSIVSIGMRSLVGLLLAMTAAAQAPQAQPAVPAQTTPPQAAPEQPALRPPYVLGPNDQIQIRVTNLPEFEGRPYRVDEDGLLSLPVVGDIRASGKTLQQLEAELVAALDEILVNPQVSISITQFRSEPIITRGAFMTPGYFALQGRRTLLDMIAASGGLRPNASRRVRVTRQLSQGSIPLPAAVVDPATNTSSVEINLNRVAETINSEEDIILMPFDVLTAATVMPVSVMGEVARPGPFEVGTQDSISLLQLLTLAGGTTPTASTEDIRVLRPVLTSPKRAEIRVNLNDVLAGRANDFPLLPNDYLLVPRKKSGIGGTLGRTLLVAVPAVITSLIFVSLR